MLVVPRALGREWLTPRGEAAPGSVPIYWYHGGIAYRTHGTRILPELRELLVDVARSRFLARGRPLTPLEATTLATKQTRIRELEKLNYEKFYT